MELQNLNQNPLSVQVQQAQRTTEEMSRRDEPKKGGSKKKLIIILVLLLLCGVGVFLIFKGVTSGPEETTIEGDSTPTPSAEVFPTEDSGSSPTPSPKGTSSPNTKIDRTKVTIKVLNGTGIPKESGLLQTKLSDLGYTKIDVGNADSTDNSDAVVTFSSSVTDEVNKEITDLLKSTYKKVVSRSASSATTDVMIITGLRSGQTLPPSASPTASSTGTPKATTTP